jgi:hypothetical protein
MTDRLRSRWDVAANGAFIIACAVLVYVALTRPGEPEVVPARSGFADGQLLDGPEILAKRGNRFVFVGVQSSCQFCTASMDFYRRLAAAVEESGLQLVVGSREPASVTKSYLEEHSVHGVPIPATPVLLMVDTSGVVSGSWLGRLSPAQEEEILTLTNGR